MIQINKLKQWGIAGLFASCTALPLFASETEEATEVSLSETTLTGINEVNVPLTLAETRITSSETLDKWSALDLEDIFKLNPSARVAGGSAQAQKIYVRSIEDTMLNVTIDGAPQAGNMFHHQGRITIEPELLKQVSTSAGTGSALNGAGALAGAIAFETKDGFDMLRKDEQFGVLLKGTGYSNGDGYKASASGYGLIGEDWSYLASVSYTDRKNYEDGDGETVENTAFERTSAFLKFTGNLTETQKLSVSYEYTQDETEGLSRLNFIPFGPPAGPPHDYAFERNTATVTYDINPSQNEWVDLETTFYFTEQEFTREQKNNPADTLTGSNVESIGLDIRNTSIVNDTISVTYGADYREDTGSILNKSSGNADVQAGKDEEVEVAGLYLQANWDVIDEITLSAGARFDSYDYEDRLGQEFDDDGFSPNLTVQVRPIEGLQLHGTYAEAFRGVGMPELFLNGPARGPGFGPAVTNAEDIDAEEAENLEFGFEYNYQNYFASGTIFRQKIDNFITPTNASSTGFAFRTNEGDFESEGYEFLVGAQWDALTTSLGVSYAEPELDGETLDEQIGLAIATGHVWFANLEYFFDVVDLTTGWRLEYVDSYSEDGIKKDSTIVHDLFARWAPTANENLTVNLTINNVFDNDYLDQATNTSGSVGYGLPSPGREFSLSVAYQF